MPTISEKLQAIVAEPPTDLVEYFGQEVPEKVRKSVGLLGIDGALAISLPLLDSLLLANSFGLVVLNDECTSNFHCYITKGPLAGGILYLCHDGRTFVAFQDVHGFLKAVWQATSEGCSVAELHPPIPPLGRNQEALAKEVEKLSINEDDDAAVAQLIVLIPALDLSQKSLVESLAYHSDFYVGEVLGDSIVARPRRNLMKAARILSSHAHFQAARAGERAVAAIYQNWS
jgi:hypothetical protein